MKRYRIASVLFVVCILFSFTFSNGFAAEKKANPMDHFGFSEEDFQNGPDVKALIEKMRIKKGWPSPKEAKEKYGYKATSSLERESENVPSFLDSEAETLSEKMQDDRPVGRSTESGTRSTCTCATVGSDMVCSGGTTTWTWSSSGGTCPGNISRDLIIEDGCHLVIQGCTIDINDDILVYDGSTLTITSEATSDAMIYVGDRMNLEGSNFYGVNSYFEISTRIYAYGSGLLSSTIDFEDVETVFSGAYTSPRFLVEDSSSLSLSGDSGVVHKFPMTVSCYSPWDNNYMFRVQGDSDFHMDLTEVWNTAQLMYFNGTGEVEILENEFYNPVLRGIWINGNTEADRIDIEGNLFSFADVDEDPLVYSYYAIRVESCSNVDNDQFTIESNVFYNASTEDVLWEKVIELKNNTADGLVQYNVMNGFEDNGIISTYNEVNQFDGVLNIVGNIIECSAISTSTYASGIYLYFEDYAYLYSNWVWNAEGHNQPFCIHLDYSHSVEIEGILGGTPDYPDLWDCAWGIYAEMSDSVNIHDVDIAINDFPSNEPTLGITIVGGDQAEVENNDISGNGYNNGFAFWGIEVIGDNPAIEYNTIDNFHEGIIVINALGFSIYGNVIDGEDIENSIGVYLEDSSSAAGSFLCNTISVNDTGVWAQYDSDAADSFILGGDNKRANYIKVPNSGGTYHVALDADGFACGGYTTNWSAPYNFFTNDGTTGLAVGRERKGVDLYCGYHINVTNSITGTWDPDDHQEYCSEEEE